MIVVECAGTGPERGIAHGETARALVHDSVNRWAAATLPHTRHVTIEAYAEAFLAETGLMRTLARLAPDLAEEIHGIADGAGLPRAVISAYNLMDEQWWYDKPHRTEAGPGCSVIGRNADATWLAQNMDLPAFLDGAQVVLRITSADDPQALMLSAAGMIGLTGINSAGVAVCVNTLLMLRHAPSGLPVSALVRIALRARCATEAAAALRRLPHASGQHYAVADAGHLIGLECSAEGCLDVPARDTLLHTNHPTTTAAIDLVIQDHLESHGRIQNSRDRLAHLQRNVPAAFPAIRQLLAEAPLCMATAPHRTMSTFGSVAFELGRPVEAWFCPASPAVGVWERLEFSAQPGRGSG